MAETTQTPVAVETAASETPRHPNGQTDEQIQKMLAALGRRKNDPEYIKRLFDGADEARRRINEEYLREMDAAEKK